MEDHNIKHKFKKILNSVIELYLLKHQQTFKQFMDVKILIHLKHPLMMNL